MKQEYTAPEAKLLVFSANEELAYSFDDLLAGKKEPGKGASNIGGDVEVIL